MTERPETLSRLALGCYPLGGGYGSIRDDQARATVDAALECGWTLFDTAEVYLASEERLGRILRGRRDRVFLATKAYPCESYSYEHLSAALEASLRRLQTDRVDLYQLHGPEDWLSPFGPTPVDELAEALDRLRRSGKALHVGVCNLPVDALGALASRTAIFSTQNLCSLIDRGDGREALLPVADEVLPYAQEHGIAVLAYSPLGRGLLADGLDPQRTFPPDDERHFLPRFQPGAYRYYATLAGKLAAWARDHSWTLAELAVGWTLRHPGVESTLIGAKTPEQVHAVAGAERITLDPQDLAELAEIVASLPPEANETRAGTEDDSPEERLAEIRRRRYLPAAEAGH